MPHRFFLACATIVGFASQAIAQPVVPLRPGRAVEGELGPGQTYTASLRLRAGESAEIAVLQQGIDLVVDLLGPDGRLIDSVDSPNGRQGDEPVAISAAAAGAYTLRIRPISPAEPTGRFAVRVVALRDRTATARDAAERRRLREQASAWLRERSAAIPASGAVQPDGALPPFDVLAAEARVVGLGEASHGSREPNDLRLALVRRLVERHGYRLIAIEGSASRWRELAGYASGAQAAPAAATQGEGGWIGLRAQRDLLEWVRRWNLDHPADLVRIVGVDPQDSRDARSRFDRFLAQAYGEEFAAAWAPASAELAAADAQTLVFGNSDVSEPVRRKVLETYARISGDEALLSERLGPAAVQDALATATELMQFADFNGGLVTPPRSRDWYMAVNLIEAMQTSPRGTKAIYWAHNAHVSAAATRWGPTGAVLRQALGCNYRAIATTFGRGGFIAQLPGDPDNRVIPTLVGEAAEETIEQVVAATGPGGRFAAWRCGARAEAPPPWLREPRPLRWIGGLYAPGAPERTNYQPYGLTAAFDAIAYLPAVTAEDPPAERPRVPPRARQGE